MTATVRNIAVLDRVKEVAALGEPLFLDVKATCGMVPRLSNVRVLGGRYGLSSKEFIPESALPGTGPKGMRRDKLVVFNWRFFPPFFFNLKVLSKMPQV